MHMSNMSMGDHQSLQDPYRSLPEVMYSLSCLANLYEIGLAVTIDDTIFDMYQNLLRHIKRVVCAQGAALLLYHAEPPHFTCAATQGVFVSGALQSSLLHSAEIAQLAVRGPGEVLTMFQLDGQRIVLVTLSYNGSVNGPAHGSLAGIVALAISADITLHTERGLLLSYMGNVAALLLRNADLRTSVRKDAIEQERQRIARDLHDGVAQQFAHILHKIEFIQHLQERGQNDAVQGELEQTHKALVSGLDEMRHSIHSWLPVQLTHQPLAVALQAYVSTYQHEHPELEVRIEPDLRILIDVPSQLEAPLFRFVQEGLENVWKHAQATHVILRMSRLPGLLVIEVSDDGIGIVPERLAEKSEGHMGLQAMRERIQQAGGLWEAHSDAHSGTTLRVCFPLVQVAGLLTPRELEILGLIGAGLTNRTIAHQLEISNDTVKTHIHHIIQKLHVKDRMQAVVFAKDNGWF